MLFLLGLVLSPAFVSGAGCPTGSAPFRHANGAHLKTDDASSPPPLQMHHSSSQLAAISPPLGTVGGPNTLAGGELIPGPTDTNDTEVVVAWRKTIEDWRTRVHRTINYTGSIYTNPALKWVENIRAEPQIHPYDRYFFDPTLNDGEGGYTVQRFLEDLKTRYGGVDSLIIWPTYPSIGADARSQFDLFEAMPGGLEGLRKVVGELHSHGVHVMIPYNPWDTGTRRRGPYPPPPTEAAAAASAESDSNVTGQPCTPADCENKTKYDQCRKACGPGFRTGCTYCPAIADTDQCSRRCKIRSPVTPCQNFDPNPKVVWCKGDDLLLDGLIRFIGADGFVGDTMHAVPENFFTTSVKLGRPVAIEPGGGGVASSGSLSWDTLGWGHFGWGPNPRQRNRRTPDERLAVDAWKWLEPRRMTHIEERSSKDHTDALQMALFNGIGMNTWENIWGTYNKVTQRDGAQIRRVVAVLRFLGSQGFLTSAEWVPFAPIMQQHGSSQFVFASRWPVADSCAWTIVNRDQKQSHTATIRGQLGLNYYDLWNGVQLNAPNGTDGISVLLEASGFGAVLVTKQTTTGDSALRAFLAKVKAMSEATPAIQDLSPEWHVMQMSRIDPGFAPLATVPPDMAHIPGGPFHFVVSGIEIEGFLPVNGTAGGAGDVQYPWELFPRRNHDHQLQLKSFLLDRNLVTQADYAEYLEKQAKLPKDTWHWLWNWDWSAGPDQMPRPFAGNESLPVTYLGLEEARAYCKAVGKRLPREEEWQYAGQRNGSQYPWGDSNASALLMPRLRTNACASDAAPADAACRSQIPGPTPVGSFPAGASPFGILDMVGNVWQYTDEYQDEHTRSVCIKGGSNYRPGGSHWYFPNNRDLVTHNKWLLMSSRYERCGTIGFRCAADLQQPPFAKSRPQIE